MHHEIDGFCMWHSTVLVTLLSTTYSISWCKNQSIIAAGMQDRYYSCMLEIDFNYFQNTEALNIIYFYIGLKIQNVLSGGPIISLFHTLI